MGNLFICLSILIIATALLVDSDSMTSKVHKHTKNCTDFSSIMRNVRHLVDSESTHNKFLERIGIVTRSSVFGVDSCNDHVDKQVESARILTIAAQIFKSEFDMPLEEFESLALTCMTEDRYKLPFKKPSEKTSNSKYRSIDGRGNNVKNPDWGSTDTPFARYTSNNYEDGIYAVGKSVTGSDLPNARELVRKVLMKAVRSPTPEVQYNLMGLMIILFATHDLHYQVPMHIKCGEGGIRCCSKGGHHVLPRDLSNSACLPIEISEKDPFYRTGKIGCLNMVRSQIGKYSNGVQTGQILNRATAFLDLSFIYGNNESELRPIRLFSGGKLRMGKNNVLPVDSNGKQMPSMNRATPIGAIWPALFSRNHNHLAERLAKLKPNWDDETIFQEARRINIANFQFNLITAKSIEKVFHKVVNVTYSEDRNAATYVEFPYTYRGGHYYIPSHMVFQNENNDETKHLQSDTIGRIELLENDFDGALRGALHQPVNVGQYSDEIVNKVGKNADGFGLDIIATDIQRSRDHGISSFVQIRRACKLVPEINSFDDFNKIFNQSNVDLLKKMYKSHEDVDYYVGGLLEAFEKVGSPFAGETFGCIIGANYNNVMGGDRWFYSHPENPYPFTAVQIAAIRSYQIPHIFCTNSGLKEVTKIWSYTPNPTNPKVDCKNYPPMDLTAWV